MAPPQVRLAKGTVLDHRFVVERVLGQGGMGIVVAARHQALRKTVAIKMMRPEYSVSPELAQRFLREARAAARLRSEHAIRVTDVDVFASGVPYFIMEYWSGLDLAKYLEQHGPLPVELVIELVLQALEAVAEGHRAGIVHRDLKPSNLLLTTRDDGSESIKVLDFGFSKCGDASGGGKLTEAGSLHGSSPYFAPEQVRDGAVVDGRADIWSIAIVAYELLLGKPPFEGHSPQALAAAICGRDPSPLPASMPPSLSRVLSKCLDKRADGRFQNVGELALALAPLTQSPGARASVERIGRLRSLEARADRTPRAPPTVEAGAPNSDLVSLSPYERDQRLLSSRAPAAPKKVLLGGLATAAFATALSLSFWMWRSGPEPQMAKDGSVSPGGVARRAPRAAALPGAFEPLPLAAPRAPAPEPASSASASGSASLPRRPLAPPAGSAAVPVVVP